MVASYKQKIFDYVKKKYGTEPDYPWEGDRINAVLRHSDTAKWYALMMTVSRKTLGINSDEKVDILNVKCDPIMIGSLLMNDGYFSAYHMNKEHWITVILDGTVPFEEICGVINISYGMTKSKKARKKI